MRIGPATTVARLPLDETVTGLWSFANVLGLLTDDIGERTPGAGVTVDGLLIRDAGIPEAAVTAHEAALAILEAQIVDGTIFARLAANEGVSGIWTFSSRINLNDTDILVTRASALSGIIQGAVTGDPVARFTVLADGVLQWGDGTAGRDVNLFRAAANKLATDDDFNVGGALDLAGAVEHSTQATTLAAQADDFAISTFTIQVFTLTGAQNISGLANGVDGRMILISNIDGTDTLTLLQENAGSAAANRFNLPGGVNLAVVAKAGVLLYYDGSTSRWLTLSI